MKKFFAVVICAIFFIIGGQAFGQDNSTDTKEYVGDVATADMTPEELAELEGDFFYDPATTDQYSPNIQRQALFSILEMVQDGTLVVKQ